MKSGFGSDKWRQVMSALPCNEWLLTCYYLAACSSQRPVELDDGCRKAAAVMDAWQVGRGKSLGVVLRMGVKDTA